MARQFKLANIRQEADGKHVAADIMSPGFDMLDARDAEVRVVSDDSTEALRVRFPSHKLAFGDILDLDR